MPIQRWIRTRLRTLVPMIVPVALLGGTMVALDVTVAEPVLASTSVGGNDYPWGGYDGPGSKPATYTWTDSRGNKNSPLKFGYRNCTDYAAYELNEQMGGTVSNPKFSFSKFGFTTADGNASGWKTAITNKLGASAANGTPAVGAVAWWGTVANGFGHVAIVSNIAYNSNGSVKSIGIADYNSGDPLDAKGNPTWGNYATHTITSGASNWPDAFLHVADVSGSGSGGTPPPPPPPGFNGDEVAFQDNTGALWVYGNAGTHDLGLGVKPGTSPAIAALSNGSYEVAFEANDGSFYLYTPGGGATDLALGMMPGTSPAITGLTGGGMEAAFQDSSGALWVYGNAGIHDLGLGMKAGTSPAIAALSNGSYEVAFQANDGSFYLYTPGGGATDLALGMMPGTSPTIIGLTGGGMEAAFEDSSGALWVYGNAGIHDLALGMMAGTSPAIAALSNGSCEVAFQGNDGSFDIYTPASGLTRVGLGMNSGTSPAITGLTGGGIEAALQDNTGALWVYGNGGTQDLKLGMMPGTSPAIAG